MSCVCPENADFCSTPLFLELDIFHDDLAPLILAEIEFPDEETANTYPAPQWLGEDVTFSSAYHNSTLSRMDNTEPGQLPYMVPALALSTILSESNEANTN